MKIRNVIRYEFDKLIHDRTRLLVFLLLLLAVIGVSFLICTFWMDDSYLQNNVWTPDYKKYLTSLKDQAWENYLINSHLKDPPPGIFIYSDPDEFLQLFKEYSFLIANRLAGGYRGFSLAKILINPALKMMMFQNLIFMFFPLVIALNIFYVFVYDKSIGYNKNYATLGINKQKLYRGKILFSATSMLLLFLVLNLLGLAFNRNLTILNYDGTDYHSISMLGSYFQRMTEMLIALSLYFVVYCILAKRSNNQFIYLTVAIFTSVLLFSCFGMIRDCLQGTAAGQQFIGDIPVVNILTASSFNDGRFLYRVGIILGADTVLIMSDSGSAIYQAIKAHFLKKRKIEQQA